MNCFAEFRRRRLRFWIAGLGVTCALSFTIVPGQRAGGLDTSFAPAPDSRIEIPSQQTAVSAVPAVAPPPDGRMIIARCFSKIQSTARNGLARIVEAAPGSQPVITGQPTNTTVSVGSDATFQVTAASNFPVTFQWQFDNQNISGATNAGLVLRNVSYIQTGEYRVILTSSAGQTVSDPALLTVHPPGALEVWKLRHRAAVNVGPLVDGFSGYAFGNDRHVAVVKTNILASTDGINWVRQTNPSGQSLNDVIFGDGKFVAVGATGTVLTSTDALNWVSQTTGSTESLTRIAFGNDVLVALGSKTSGTTALRSANGIEWTQSNVTNSLDRILFGNGLFLGVGAHEVVTSTDGFSWVVHPVPLAAAGDAVFFKNRFMVVARETSSILISTNGGDWLEHDFGMSLHLRAIAASAQTVVVTGGDLGARDWLAFPEGPGPLLVSSDGVSWSAAINPSPHTISSVRWAGGWFFAQSDPRYPGAPRDTLISPDGVRWRIAGVPSSLRGVVFGDGKFVAAGDYGLILTSPDGANWNEQSSPTVGRLAALDFANGTFVAVGRGGVILSSTNGVDWLQRDSGTTRDLTGLTHGNGIFVTVGGEGGGSTRKPVILISSDGVSWRFAADQVSGRPYGVAYGDGHFLAVGDYATRGPGIGGVWQNFAITSPDGAAWAASAFKVAPTPFSSLVFGNGTFVAGDPSRLGVLAIYTNAWRQVTLGANVFGLAIGNNTFLATSQSAVFTSTNATQWTRRNVGIDVALIAAAFGNGTFVVVGDKETILQSAEVTDDSVLIAANPHFAGPTFQIGAPTVRGTIYALEATDNLEKANWTRIGTIAGDGSVMTISDSAPPAGRRFYRMVRP